MASSTDSAGAVASADLPTVLEKVPPRGAEGFGRDNRVRDVSSGLQPDGRSITGSGASPPAASPAEAPGGHEGGYNGGHPSRPNLRLNKRVAAKRGGTQAHAAVQQTERNLPFTRGWPKEHWSWHEASAGDAAGIADNWLYVRQDRKGWCRQYKGGGYGGSKGGGCNKGGKAGGGKGGGGKTGGVFHDGSSAGRGMGAGKGGGKHSQAPFPHILAQRHAGGVPQTFQPVVPATAAGNQPNQAGTKTDGVPQTFQPGVGASAGSNAPSGASAGTHTSGPAVGVDAGQDCVVDTAACLR